MAKAKIWGKSEDGSEEAKRVIAIMCPGCNCTHIIATKTPFSNGAVWGFNNNFDRPTFTPSLLVKTGKYVDSNFDDEGHPEMFNTICHSFIKDGRIQFLGDCTHQLKNQTVELPEIN